ncbi:biosynthetic-type acetolactate synthase large subunit [Zymomonas mobilis]|uniref:Acetolactate synthase n=1 Tax=Zymomonas mobilis subsp. mobilis (strain ATCC 10988 / DSM 424 / LMG 404 / NCIMB 8938 / NRRL B-806 / ZM1) TaxID=555217 RepID=A0A0H3FWB3_ZYMMA|nr:biosynthetic-type acetolactate synthase large subunit [Zymomonas mobilis]AEH62040.1 acetolactate synthase, large subunit, biosynthetic type [Zymomonas mobilis subsp. mobilis ATCC 10988]TQL28365.1 acetolactate synthase large subunit [Zymomonas mobilis]TQL30301.1 acetolactate synthase large subunit [Zymomonas mobilis]
MCRQLSGAAIVLETLKDMGVDLIFGYPGGAVLPIYDALYQDEGIRHILARQEGGAVHAAEGYARSTGKPGVVIVTSGPGATNAVTGIADAMLDSIPLVVFSGQVATNLIGTDAFQEADTIGITRHCTKHNYLVRDPKDLAQTIVEAFHLATSGRPGPVVIDLPKNVQTAVIDYIKPDPNKRMHRGYRPRVKADPVEITNALDMIAKAKRPVFYTGGGVINSGPDASKALRELADLTGVPVTSTLMGLGAFPASSQQWLGMLGMHGTYEANFAMHDADLVVALGSRFDDRVTCRVDSFSPHSKKIHVDIDRSSINRIIHVDLPIVGDVGSVMQDMVALWKEKHYQMQDISAWWVQIDEWRAKQCLNFTKQGNEIMPQQAIRSLWEATKGKNPIVSTEVGQHQMWTAQYFGFDSPNHFLTSGGLGTMGYGFPSIIGAQVGNPDSLCMTIAGEASFQMNIQEMATVAQYRLPVKIFILNNRFMGMVRQWQDLLYDHRRSQSYSEALPDFVALAKAYGWNALKIEKPSQLEDGIKTMLETPGPVLVDCQVAQLANCLPMVPPGAGQTEMILESDITDNHVKKPEYTPSAAPPSATTIRG